MSQPFIVGHARSRKTHCCGQATIVAQCVAVGDKQILAKFVQISYAGYVYRGIIVGLREWGF